MKARETPSAAEAIAESLRHHVVNELADGEFIGSAEDLADQFQVSEPTVRQTMRILEAEGLVRVRRGNSGGFFASTPSIDNVSRSAAALLRRQGADLGDLVEVSQMIGPEVVAHAAGNPDATVRRRLIEFVDQAWADDVEVTVIAATKTAVEFGRLMGEVCGSPSLALISSMMSDLVTNLMFEVIEDVDSPDLLQGYAMQIRSGHIRLAQAIADGDISKARAVQREMNLIVST
jgi:GntR family transcriptional regulator, transcriptional repressor for pyruvate dehydrogenase complex